MPKRMIDGEALWRSDKLRLVPVEFRAEYANLIPLAEADGTFEANCRKVWSDVYSYNRDDITSDLVEDILAAFEKAGMLIRKTDENGKLWGKFVGIETRLPADSQKGRYKQGKAQLFTTSIQTPEDIQSTSRVDQEDIKLGLDRLGKDRIAIGERQSVAEDLINPEPTYREGAYPGKSPKILHNYIVEAWQRVKGLSAIARYPSRYPQKWEEHCQNHSGDLIIPAFELWAREEGIYSQNEYPVTGYLQNAAKYLEMILPTKKPKKPKKKPEDLTPELEAQFAASDAATRAEIEESERKYQEEQALINNRIF